MNLLGAAAGDGAPRRGSTFRPDCVDGSRRARLCGGGSGVAVTLERASRLSPADCCRIDSAAVLTSWTIVETNNVAITTAIRLLNSKVVKVTVT